jgi:hypothetical protein
LNHEDAEAQRGTEVCREGAKAGRGTKKLYKVNESKEVKESQKVKRSQRSYIRSHYA